MLLYINLIEGKFGQAKLVGQAKIGWPSRIVAKLNTSDCGGGELYMANICTGTYLLGSSVGYPTWFH